MFGAKTMKRTASLSWLFCLVVSLLMFSTQVSAEGTPDGVTPAVEVGCDSLLGEGAASLYGLCVAYCEAQDQDEFRKDPAGSRLEDNAARRGGSIFDCEGLSPPDEEPPAPDDEIPQ